MPAAQRQVESCYARHHLPSIFFLTKNNIERLETLVPFRGFRASKAKTERRSVLSARELQKTTSYEYKIDANFLPATIRSIGKIGLMNRRSIHDAVDWQRRVDHSGPKLVILKRRPGSLGRAS